MKNENTNPYFSPAAVAFLSVKSLGEVMTDLELDTFTGYAKDAGLWNNLEKSKENYTLFVPSEEAFASKSRPDGWCCTVHSHCL